MAPHSQGIVGLARRQRAMKKAPVAWGLRHGVKRLIADDQKRL